MPKDLLLHRNRDNTFRFRHPIWSQLEKWARMTSGLILLIGLSLVFFSTFTLLLTSTFFILLVLDRLWGIRVMLRPPFPIRF